MRTRSHSSLYGMWGSSSPRPFGATDMELLRQCPCPVWLIGAHPPHHPLRVVAAVHANPEDPTEQALNATILEWGLTLKRWQNELFQLMHAVWQHPIATPSGFGA